MGATSDVVKPEEGKPPKSEQTQGPDVSDGEWAWGRRLRENAFVLLSRSRTLTVTTLILAGVLIPVAAAAAILGALFVVPALWNFFGITPTPTWHWLKMIPAFFAETIVISSLLYLPIGAVIGFAYVLNLYAEIAASPVMKQVSKLREQQKDAETVLEQSDPTGLMPLVRYSRAQLEAYYTVGLNQTQRSFRYSVIAMWLGFAVLLAGLTYQTLPLNLIVPKISQPPGNVAVIALAGSTVIELIAALFLWVYRSSISQLNYFYNRQIYIHNVILCFRMAMTMKQPDDAVRAIVDRVLAQTWTSEPLAAPSGRTLAEMFGGNKPVTVN